MRGWGDESESQFRLDPGAYVLATALVASPADLDVIRLGMQSLRPPGAKKVHWKDDDSRRHRLVVELMLDLPFAALVVVRVGTVTDRHERRRRKCLEELLPRLGDAGCEELTLESRGQADDRKDRDMHNYLRRAHRLTTPLHLNHLPGPAEPALWAADALCGAVASARCGEPEHLKRLEARIAIEVVEISV